MILCMGLTLGLMGCGQEGQGGGKKSGVPSPYGVKEVVQAQKDKEDEAKGIDALKNQEKKTTGEEEEKVDATREKSEPVEEPSEESKKDPVKESETPAESVNADVDLTVMSSTMVYSEVYNMMYTPEDYVGKVIKIQGQYAVSEAGGNRYDLCVIQDATACCAQGMEFLLSDAYAYPGDYPEVGDEITVMGTFVTYMEGEYMYCTLQDAQLF